MYNFLNIQKSRPRKGENGLKYFINLEKKELLLFREFREGYIEGMVFEQGPKI